MKMLSKFQYFDTKSFFERISVMGMKSEDYLEYGSQEKKGIKVTGTIWFDRHDYGNTSVSNVGEQIVIKVLDPNAELLDFTTPHFIEVINPTGKIYGDFANQLSLVADQVIIKEDNDDEF
ncbi:hypothetical protein [Leuconostoc lactis]|uniref:hypothetical protein n=1 Tax=Leuconostoc lactis TaxID=1246 RepID=UPI0031D33721